MNDPKSLLLFVNNGPDSFFATFAVSKKFQGVSFLTPWRFSVNVKTVLLSIIFLNETTFITAEHFSINWWWKEKKCSL